MRSTHGVILIADVSGFTRLSDLAKSSLPSNLDVSYSDATPHPRVFGRMNSTSEIMRAAQEYVRCSLFRMVGWPVWLHSPHPLVPLRARRLRSLRQSQAVVLRKGAEELLRILNAYFSTLMSVVLEHGGDIIRVAGVSGARLLGKRNAADCSVAAGCGHCGV